MVVSSCPDNAECLKMLTSRPKGIIPRCDVPRVWPATVHDPKLPLLCGGFLLSWRSCCGQDDAPRRPRRSRLGVHFSNRSGCRWHSLQYLLDTAVEIRRWFR